MDQFLSYMNEEDNFDSFPDIGDVITSVIVRTLSFLHSWEIVRRDIKPENVLVSNYHYKSYKHEELEMAFGKNLLSVNFLIRGKQDLCIHRLTV